MVDFCGRDRAIERDGAGERGWFERVTRSGEDDGVVALPLLRDRDRGGIGKDRSC